MTKKVRIENADTSHYKLVAQLFDKGREGEPDTLVTEFQLDYPTALAEIYIHSTRYIVIKEAPATTPGA